MAVQPSLYLLRQGRTPPGRALRAAPYVRFSSEIPPEVAFPSRPLERPARRAEGASCPLGISQRRQRDYQAAKYRQKAKSCGDANPRQNTDSSRSSRCGPAQPGRASPRCRRPSLAGAAGAGPHGRGRARGCQAVAPGLRAEVVLRRRRPLPQSAHRAAPRTAPSRSSRA